MVISVRFYSNVNTEQRELLLLQTQLPLVNSIHLSSLSLMQKNESKKKTRGNQKSTNCLGIY